VCSPLSNSLGPCCCSSPLPAREPPARGRNVGALLARSSRVVGSCTGAPDGCLSHCRAWPLLVPRTPTFTSRRPGWPPGRAGLTSPCSCTGGQGRCGLALARGQQGGLGRRGAGGAGCRKVAPLAGARGAARKKGAHFISSKEF
jgi:hypothetical protein